MDKDTPLIGAPDRALAVAVEENLFGLFRAMASALPGAELEETGRLGRHLAFPMNPMFKGAWNSRFAADEADAAIEETLAWFRERESPFLFWWTGPGTTLPDLGERLVKRGLISMEEQSKELARGILQTAAGAPCLVADLDRMNEAVLERTPPGFAIEEIADERSLLDFRRVFVETYAIPEWAGQAWVDAALRVGIGRTPWRMYLGRLHGEPVATNMLFLGGGIASVYAVASHPSARGKNIGGAITLKPLLEARAQGYRHAGLFSTEMGVRTYRNLGFRMTDARINRYLWRDA